MNEGEIAKQNFLSGLNCAQAVVLAFKDRLGMEEKALKRLSVGFGGGLARQRLTCGAVSGMTFVLSYLLSNGEDKTEIYAIIREACAEFKNKLGSLICAELLAGVETTAGGVPEERTQIYYKKRPCAEICETAAEITAEYLEKYSAKK